MNSTCYLAVKRLQQKFACTVLGVGYVLRSKNLVLLVGGCVE